jgi:hypothetical protein
MRLYSYTSNARKSKRYRRNAARPPVRPRGKELEDVDDRTSTTGGRYYIAENRGMPKNQVLMKWGSRGLKCWGMGV